MRKAWIWVLLIPFFVSSSAWSQTSSRDTKPTSQEIAAAVEFYRAYASSGPEEPEVSEDELDAHAHVLRFGGSEAIQAVLRAVTTVEKDAKGADGFRIWACRYLWQMEESKRFEDIKRIWLEIGSFDANFAFAFRLARTIVVDQGERAIPLLRAMLPNRKGEVLLEEYSPFGFPRTHVMLWGEIGDSGCQALLKILETESDEAVRSTVIRLLGFTTYLPALDTIRKIAHDGEGEARRSAIAALGVYGHPDDFDFLTSLLGDSDEEIVNAAVIALFDYEDLRAVPLLLPMLDSQRPRLQSELFATLGHLATIEVLERFTPMLKAAPAGLPETFEQFIMPGFRAIGVTWKSYREMTPEKRAETIALARAKLEETYQMLPGDRPLAHDDLLKIAQSWIEARTFGTPESEWVQDKQILAACTIADVPLLLEVRGACLDRGNDEGFDNADRIDRILRRLVRQTYRKEVGVCTKVEGRAQ